MDKTDSQWKSTKTVPSTETVSTKPIVVSKNYWVKRIKNVFAQNLSENPSQLSVKDEPLIVATVEKVPVSAASTHHQAITSQTEPGNGH